MVFILWIREDRIWLSIYYKIIMPTSSCVSVSSAADVRECVYVCVCVNVCDLKLMCMVSVTRNFTACRHTDCSLDTILFRDARSETYSYSMLFFFVWIMSHSIQRIELLDGPVECSGKRWTNQIDFRIKICVNTYETQTHSERKRLHWKIDTLRRQINRLFDDDH